MNDPNQDFSETIALICESDPRYARKSYFFLRQAMDYTVKKVRKKSEPGKSGHVSGQELLEGIRRFALEQYGPMVRSVLEHWGVRNCRDFGNIVFNMVEFKVLGKTDEDGPEDFDDGYDFRTAFDEPYLP